MATESEDLALKLENYVLQLRQVEAALEEDPTHIELLKIKADLNELIDLTKNLLSAKISEGAPITKKAKLSSENATTVRCQNAAAGSSKFAETKSVGKLISRIKTFDDNSYREFMFGVLDESRPAEVLKTIIKRFTNRGKKSIKRKLQHEERKAKDESDTDDEDNVKKCNGQESSRSAWKAPLIYRGDIISFQNDVLCMIVKQIRLKSDIHNSNRGHKMVPAVVCVVNSKKNLVFWSLIKWEENEICETFPATTGIIKNDGLLIGLPLDQVTVLLQRALKGNRLIGYNTEDSLRSLNINHGDIEDIKDYFCDQNEIFALDDLKCIVEKRGSENGVNNVVHEARILLALYLWMKGNQTSYPVFSKCPLIEMIKKFKQGRIQDKVENLSNSCKCMSTDVAVSKSID